MNKLTDSHMHMDLVFLSSSKRVEWLIRNNCTCISWAFGKSITSDQDLQSYLRRQHEIVQDLNTLTLKTYYLTGIHPRNIYPDLTPEKVETFLLPHLDDDLCLGIGEIGLETGSQQEKELFIAQLEFASKLDVNRYKIGIHTPRKKKIEITTTILELLKSHEQLKPRIVMDHLGTETISSVLNSGYIGGVTLAPEKSSLKDLKNMIESIPGFSENIMCNSDSSTEVIEDFINASHDIEINQTVKDKLFYHNARNFWGLG